VEQGETALILTPGIWPEVGRQSFLKRVILRADRIAPDKDRVVYADGQRWHSDSAQCWLRWEHLTESWKNLVRAPRAIGVLFMLRSQASVTLADYRVSAAQNRLWSDIARTLLHANMGIFARVSSWLMLARYLPTFWWFILEYDNPRRSGFLNHVAL